MSTPLHQQLQATLGDSYTLERELGGGGMARVFLAEETALGRRVVVKVLAPDVVQELSAERFAREIRLSARLQHPNIVPVLRAGVAGGVPYYTMPFVEGETLRARLARLDPGDALPIAEAVAILRDMARALAYAHAQGVVHRDVKPENILLADDAVVVADFGIAKAVDAARSQGAVATGAAGGATLTRLGAALGTPAYMAPEQAAGDPETDYRADLYAWGVVAYEMLVGRHPFAGKRSTHALVAAHLTEAPPPIADAQPSLPAPLAALVTRCLAKAPAERPASARDVVRALADAVAVSGELAPHPGAPRASLTVGPSEAARPSVASVAVIPFANTSGDPESEHFSDGLTDELIGALSKVGALQVTGRTSSFALKGKGLDVRAIAATLRVGAVLEGSVRRAGSRLKVSVQLVNADGSVRWAERYDRTLTDVFAVQEEIAQAVVRALPLHLGAAPEALVRPATANLAAYELYLKGKFAMYRVGPGDLRDAIGYFEQAVAVDPDFAAAYAWLAHAHLLTVVFGGLPAHGPMGLASGYADRAVALDSGSADAHWIRAMVAFLWTWDWGEAERAFERALALEPGHANARHIYAVYLHAQRRFAESREEIARALATDPLVVNGRLTLGRVLLSVGEVDGAIGHLREAVRMLPRSAFPRTCLGHAYFLAGRPDEALAEFERAVDTGLPAERAELAYAYARVGRRDDALSLVRALRAPEPDIYPPPYHLAIAYTGLGDPDEAFRWLDRAYDERAPALADRLLVEPALAPLRADPRFPQLARRLGLDARA